RSLALGHLPRTHRRTAHPARRTRPVVLRESWRSGVRRSLGASARRAERTRRCAADRGGAGSRGAGRAQPGKLPAPLAWFPTRGLTPPALSGPGLAGSAMASLSGRRALVCGSTQGIGRASAEALASEGAEIVLLARNAERLREVRHALPRRDGVSHDLLVADFSDPAGVRRVVSEYLASHLPFHILVNNTGGPPPGLLIEATEAAFRAAFDMHLFCNHALVQAVVPGMRQERYGRIVN